MSVFSRIGLSHATKKPKASAEGNAAPAPQPRSGKSQIFGFSLPGLKRRSSTSASVSASAPSMPPRSALRPKPGKALGENSLAKLMHAEAPTAFTANFIRGEEEKAARLAQKKTARVNHDPAAKLTSGHEVIHQGPEDVTRMNRTAQARARDAGAEIFELMKDHPPGAFDAEFERGEIPTELLSRMKNPDEVDHADVISAFEDKQRSYSDYLLHTAALSLKKLNPRSMDEAEALLQGIIENPHLHRMEEHALHEITEEDTPQQAILAALAELPERRRGDLIDAFENLDKPHPRAEMQARGQEYEDTIDARLAEVNRPGR